MNIKFNISVALLANVAVAGVLYFLFLISNARYRAYDIKFLVLNLVPRYRLLKLVLTNKSVLTSHSQFLPVPSICI